MGREAGTSADGAATQGVGNVGFAARAAATEGAGPSVQQWRSGSMKQLGGDDRPGKTKRPSGRFVC
ncbi:hypothetical protein D3C71_1850700 [compost metagenome]